jgi:hypothetical protein
MTINVLSKLTIAAAATMLVAACAFEQKNSVMTPVAPTTGSGGSSSSFVGMWSSQALTTSPDAATCGNLQWNVTSQSATAIAGTFSALCAGNVTVSGTASGQLNGSEIPMTASGTATAPGIPVGCPFSLVGTGHPQSNGSLVIDYVGTTCVGNVHGTETLRHATP